MKKTGILDNKSLGNVVSELKGNIAAGCTLSVVSALFSLYAYDELKKELSKVIFPQFSGESVKPLFDN